MDTTELKEFIKDHQRDWIVILATVFFTIVLIGFFSFFSSPASSGEVVVPIEFLDARSRAGGLADELADLVKSAANDLEAISEADRAENYARGLELAQRAADQNADIRQVAVSLSKELTDMATLLDQIEPENAEAIARAAATTGVELVQRMVNYNNFVYDLLEAAEERLEAGGGEAERERIENIIRSMNEEANTVNTLNEDYRRLMLQFDELTQ